MCLLTECVCLVSFSSGTSCFDDRWSPLVRSPTKNARKADPDCLISERLASVVESQCCWALFWSCRSCLKPSVTDSLLLGGSIKRTCWLLHSNLAGGWGWSLFTFGKGQGLQLETRTVPSMGLKNFDLHHFQEKSHGFEACDNSEQCEMPRWGRPGRVLKTWAHNFFFQDS